MIQLCTRLARVGVEAVEMEDQNYVAFDNMKNEMIVFSRRRKQVPKRRIAEDRIILYGHTMGFNTEATR